MDQGVGVEVEGWGFEGWSRGYIVLPDGGFLAFTVKYICFSKLTLKYN